MKKLLSVLLSTLIVLTIANIGAVSMGLATSDIPELVVCPLPNADEHDLANPRLYGASYAVQDEYDERAQAAPFATSQTLKLHSRPGAKKTIYLDFDGHTTKNTLWNYPDYRIGGFGSSIVTPPFSIDNNKSTNFSAIEHAAIQQIWQGVADDYAIFDVDVTTEDPGDAKLERSSLSDSEYGMRACIGGSQADWLYSPGTAGIAYVDIFGDVPTTYNLNGVSKLAPAMIFSEELIDGGTAFTYNIRQLTCTISHEIGHTLSLSHDGLGNGSNDSYANSAYFGSDYAWSPIMGYATGGHASQWSKGEYSRASNKEDDIAIIGGKLGFIADDASNTSSAAATIPLSNKGNGSKKGIIGRNGDKDFYQFTLKAPAMLDITANSGLAFNDANLDVKMTLYNASNAVLGTSNITEDTHEFISSFKFWRWAENYEDSHALMGASIKGKFLAAGTYYISIEGTGATFQDSENVNYSTYGSVGNYTINIETIQNAVTGITLDKSNLLLSYQDNATIFATIAPTNPNNSNIIWTSSNENIVSVSSSNNDRASLYGRWPGTATITATTEQGGFTASCVVTVFDIFDPANDQTSVDYAYDKYFAEISKNGKAPGSDEYILYVFSNFTLDWFSTPTADVTAQVNIQTDITGGPYLKQNGTITRPENNWSQQVGGITAECPYYSVTVVFKKGSAQSQTLSFGVKVPPICVYGDTDNDGTLTSLDALIALKMSIGLEHNDFHLDRYTYQGFRADHWYDDVISAHDAFAILKEIVTS